MVTKATQERLDAWYGRMLSCAPVPTESRHLKTRFGTTHVLCAGKAGTPVVLVPGFGANAAMWLKTMAILAQHHRLYALDIPGHPGHSAPEPIAAKGPGFGLWLDDVLSELQLPSAAFVGASMGSIAVLKLAVLSPSRIDRAALVVPGGIVPVTYSGLVALMVRALAHRMAPSRQRVERIALRLARPAKDLDPDFVGLLEIALSPDYFHADPALFRAIPAEQLKDFNAPVVVFAGEQDLFFPGASLVAQARRALRSVTVHLVKGLGHMPTDSSMGIVHQEVARFLAGHDGQAAAVTLSSRL